MAVDAELRSENRLVAQKLDDERRSERGHPVARRRGAGREKRGATIRRSRMDPRRSGHAKAHCFLRDAPDRRARLQNDRQFPDIRSGPRDPVGPSSRDRIVAGLQRIVPVAAIEPSAEPSSDPIRLVQDVASARPILHHQDPRERGRRPSGRASGWRMIGDRTQHGFIVARLVVHARPPDWRSRLVHREHRPGRSVDRYRAHAAEIAFSAKIRESGAHGAPPALGRGRFAANGHRRLGRGKQGAVFRQSRRPRPGRADVNSNNACGHRASGSSGDRLSVGLGFPVHQFSLLGGGQDDRRGVLGDASRNIRKTSRHRVRVLRR